MSKVLTHFIAFTTARSYELIVSLNLYLLYEKHVWHKSGGENVRNFTVSTGLDIQSF